MAQAARLNLRMQKELKLLLSDPPHGASFPILSDSDSSAAVTLSSIDALIEGPEGTVYENGVFHIKIQIPELYPFQPPSVTFRTPIYHPNIDTGGRICLDILNLPPKGAWQPSLNISTVLTSIGLLLSEPNPDDGLMCEASREYKYNRQIFDQKARSMTEKYAQAGASSQSILTGSRPSTMENERPNQEKKCEVDQTLSEKKSLGLSRKLSLDLSSAKKESVCDGKSSEAPNYLLHPANCEEQIKIVAPKKEAGGNNVNSNKLTGVKLSLTRRKLSPSSSCQSQQRDEVSLQNVLPNAHHSALNPQPDFTACSETSSIHSAIDNHHTNYDQDQHKRLSLSSKKPCQVFQPQSVASIDPSAGQIHIISDTKPVKFTSKIKKLSLGLKRPLQIEDNDNKENLNSRHESGRKQPYGKEKHALGVSTPLKSQQMSKDSSCVWNMKSSKDDNGKLYAQNTRLKLENSHVADDVIVLDSEDSDEDFRPIARKPLGKIWRANVGV